MLDMSGRGPADRRRYGKERITGGAQDCGKASAAV
jgi:hypothetical protein